MVTRTDYDKIAVRAAYTVLLEITRVLGDYRDGIVVVGGWVPHLLFKGQGEQHTGSIDVDLALDHQRISDEGYRGIRDLLLERGYGQGKQPFIFKKVVTVAGTEATVQVDLLSGQYGGTGAGHRHQRVQAVFARKVRGCDIAFTDPVSVTIEGILPDGAKDSAEIKVASIVAFLTMKAIVLDSRLKEKDAYDIYYCLKQYGGNLDRLVEKFKPYRDSGLVHEGLDKLARHFESVSHTGPKFVADFEEITDPEQRQLVERDAFERVQYLLKEIDATNR